MENNHNQILSQISNMNKAKASSLTTTPHLTQDSQIKDFTGSQIMRIISDELMDLIRPQSHTRIKGQPINLITDLLLFK